MISTFCSEQKFTAIKKNNHQEKMEKHYCLIAQKKWKPQSILMILNVENLYAFEYLPKVQNKDRSKISRALKEIILIWKFRLNSYLSLQ